MGDSADSRPTLAGKIHFPLLGERPWRGNVYQVIRSRLGRQHVHPPIEPVLEPPPAPSWWSSLRMQVWWRWFDYRWRALFLWSVASALCAGYWFGWAPLVSMNAKAVAANAMFQSLATVLAILVTIGVFSFSRLAEMETELTRVRSRYDDALYRTPDAQNVTGVRAELPATLKTSLRQPTWNPTWGLLRMWLDMWILEFQWSADIQRNNLFLDEIMTEAQSLGFTKDEALKIFTTILNQHAWMRNDPVRFFEFLSDVLWFAGRYSVQDAPQLLENQGPTFHLLKKLDQMFRGDNIHDIASTINKYRRWSGSHFRGVASIVFGLFVVNGFLLPTIDTVSWGFGLFVWLFVYALAVLVFYILSIFNPREWIEKI